MIFGGTDLNEHIHDSKKFHVMSRVVENARYIFMSCICCTRPLPRVFFFNTTLVKVWGFFQESRSFLSNDGIQS